MTVRHFLTLTDISGDEFKAIINRAIELKAILRRGEIYEPLKNRVLAMIFEKSSTRTRVSFEAGMAQFGGHAMFLSPRDTQLGRGEPIEDSARVISSMVDVVMIRTAYQYPIMTPLFQVMLTNNNGSTRTMLSTVVLQTEPYEFEDD